MSEPGGTHPRDLLSAYLDDELGLDERQAVDRHLALCERCRKDLLSIRALARGVADEPVPEVPPELLMRIGRILDEAQVTPIRKRRGFMIPATIAATAAAVGLVAVLQLRQRIEQAPLPAPTDVPVRVRPELQKSQGVEGGARDEMKRDQPVEKDVFRQPESVVVPERSDDAKAKQSVSGGFAPVPDAVTNEPAPLPAPAATAPPAGRLMQLDSAEAKKEAAREAPAEPSAAAGLRSAGDVGGNVTSVCAERWVDTAVLATWVVPNVDAAVMDLQGIARANGGRVERVDPYPAQFALIVPRGRLASATADLKRHGVSGLDAAIHPEEGFDCVRQRVSLVGG